MRSLKWLCLGLCLFWLSCSGPPVSQERFRLSTDGGEIDAAPQVLRLSLEGLHEVPSSDIWLILGELNSTSQNKLRRYEVPETVANKRVPLASWYDGQERIIAATELLDLGERYSLLALGYGLLGEIRVSESEETVLTRVGQGDVTHGGYVAYCAGEGARREWTAASAILSSERSPAGFEAGLAAGVGESYCVRIPAVAHVGDLFVPPARAGGNLLSPAPIRVVERANLAGKDQETVAVKCDSEFPILLANGCLGASDSALRLKMSTRSVLLELEGPLEPGGAPVVRQLFVQTEKGKSQIWGPLLPETDYLLRIFEFDRASLSAGLVAHEEELRFQSAEPAPRWVITEVLADPQGAEPAGEWIEIVNAGTAAGSLVGLELWDSSGGVPLPEVSLEPGQFGLVVRPDFDFSEDLVPDARAAAIVVPTLGQNGLKNSGERVEIRDGTGKVLSAFPAKAGKTGQSVARLSLWSSDEDVTQFVLHGPPGSTPGAGNSFAP